MSDVLLLGAGGRKGCCWVRAVGNLHKKVINTQLRGDNKCGYRQD